MADKQIKERPILFSSAMVRAILEGRKTQTRRVVSQRNSDVAGWLWKRLEFDQSKVPDPGPITFADNGYLHVATKPHPEDSEKYLSRGDWWTMNRVHPIYENGDRLWVRETWAPIPPERPSGYFTDPQWIGRDVWYLADNDKPTWAGKWRPSTNMPRAASRITLEIVGVGVERLNSITEEDAEAEGPTRMNCGDFGMERWTSAFRNLWIDIKGHGSWEKNPWVWKISFERIGLDEC